MRSGPLSLMILTVLGACTFGPRAEEQPLARQPRGANVTIHTRAQPITGELLAVQDTALVVLHGTPRRVVLVPFRLIREGEIEMLRQITSSGRIPPAEHRERMRRISRFPQGIGPELQRALLAAHDQAEILVVGQ